MWTARLLVLASLFAPAALGEFYRLSQFLPHVLEQNGTMREPKLQLIGYMRLQGSLSTDI